MARPHLAEHIWSITGDLGDWKESGGSKNLIITVVGAFLYSQRSETFKLLASITIIPNITNFLLDAVPLTLTALSDLAAGTGGWFGKRWRRTIGTQGIVKIWTLGSIALALVVGATFTWVLDLCGFKFGTCWDSDSWDTVSNWIAWRRYASELLTTFSGIPSVADEVISRLADVVLLSLTVLAGLKVVTSDDSGKLVTAAVDALVITLGPGVTLYPAESLGLIFVVTLVTFNVTVSDLTTALDFSLLWWATVITWSNKIWWKTERLVTDALLALTSSIIGVVKGSEAVVLWAWDIVVVTLDFWWTTAVWTLPAVAAAVITEVLGVMGLAFADTSRLSLATVSSVGAGDRVASAASTGLAGVYHPSVAESVVL